MRYGDDYDLALRFLGKFDGNRQAYGSDFGSAVRGNVDADLVYAHLAGDHGIGIYPIRHYANDIWVHWGCCDIDTGDWGEAYFLTVALDAMGITPVVERSRSKGWHVWVFAEGWVPARTMRRALKVAYASIDLVAKEANPKSETLRPNQLGNYVRLPYKSFVRNPNIDRQIVMTNWNKDDDGQPMPLDDFMEWDPATPNTVFERWAAKWREPVRTQGTYTSDEDAVRLGQNITGTLKYLWRDGPKNEHKRSDGLVALAFRLRDQGFTPDQVFTLVVDADHRWGKYWERPNGEEYLMDIVDRAFQ